MKYLSVGTADFRKRNSVEIADAQASFVVRERIFAAISFTEGVPIGLEFQFSGGSEELNENRPNNGSENYQAGQANHDDVDDAGEV